MGYPCSFVGPNPAQDHGTFPPPITEENRKSYSPLQRVIVGTKRETGWSPIYCSR